jgi:hypothetical protein
VPGDHPVNTAEVLATVRDLEALLRKHKVKYLALVEEKRNRLEGIHDRALPASVRREILGLFGGMGSLNDVLISRLNGHDVDNESTANEQLDRMTSQLWSLLAGPKR